MMQCAIVQQLIFEILSYLLYSKWFQFNMADLKKLPLGAGTTIYLKQDDDIFQFHIIPIFCKAHLISKIVNISSEMATFIVDCWGGCSLFTISFWLIQYTNGGPLFSSTEVSLHAFRQSKYYFQQIKLCRFFSMPPMAYPVFSLYCGPVLPPGG